MKTSQPMTLRYLSLAFVLFPFSYGSTRTYWSRRFHTSIIVGGWIYIDGGEITWGDGKFDRDNTTYGLDLSKDWTNSSLNMIQTERPSDSPALNNEVLWYDIKQDAIYCFGGSRSFATSVLNNLSPPPDSIWGFGLNGEGSANWYQVLGPVSKPFPSDIHRISGGRSASDGSSAYYLGGFGSWETSVSLQGFRLSSPGLLVFDFDTLTMTNSSDNGYNSFQNPGAMINIPTYGDNGVLLLLPDGSSQNIGFNNITLYDKKNQKWYSQVASGDIPELRQDFCAVGVEGDEYPYFEIFIHGGVIDNVFGPKASNSDQVYILSLPSFRWFRADYTPVNSRGGHTCHATNSSQMILIGGSDPKYSVNWLGDGGVENASDTWPQGIGVFDMTALKFKDSYQAKTGAYETPDVIKKYHSIDGNKYPPLWTSVAVKEIFERASNKPSNTTNSTTTNSTAKPGLLLSPNSKSTSGVTHGVVAGIVVGCTAAIAFVAVGAICMKKHRSRITKSIDFPSELPSNSPFEPSLEELLTERHTQELPNSLLGEWHKPELPTSLLGERHTQELPSSLLAELPTQRHTQELPSSLLAELPTERHTQELPSSFGDRAELPGRSNRSNKH